MRAVREAPEKRRPRGEPCRPWPSERDLAVGVVPQPAVDLAALRRQPADVLPADEDLGVGAGLGEERRRLECALASADDEHAAARERTEVVVVRRVRDERARKPGEPRRQPRERHDPGRHDHLLRADVLSVVELHVEAAGIRRDAQDAASLEPGDRPRLEPAAVLDEAGKRHRLCALEAARLLEAVEAERVIGVGDMGRLPARAKEHARGHVTGPALHRLAEDPHVHAGFEQVRGGGEPVRPRADDDDRRPTSAVVATRAGRGRDRAAEKPQREAIFSPRRPAHKV